MGVYYSEGVTTQPTQPGAFSQKLVQNEKQG